MKNVIYKKLFFKLFQKASLNILFLFRDNIRGLVFCFSCFSRKVCDILKFRMYAYFKTTQNEWISFCGIIFLVCFFFQAFAQEAQQCSGGEEATRGEKPRFCFFSLNGKDESEGLCRQLWKLVGIPDPDKNCESLPLSYKDRIEIKEYYTDTLNTEESSEQDAQSLEDKFREMTNEKCDALTISGLHAGYFTGKKTDPNNRTPSHSALTLDFLEKFSCHNDENCKKWFSDIKMLHLHGAHTWGGHSPSDPTKNVDQRMKELREGFSEDEWNSNRLAYLNREYASTVDQGNPLSHRYLRIFPNASVLAWSGKSVTIENNSVDTLLAHFKNLSKARHISQNARANVRLRVGFNVFLDFLNPDRKFTHEDICTAWREVGEPYPNAKTPAGFVENKEANNKARELGCAFSNAVDSKDGEQIRTALLGSEESAGILGESDPEKKKQYVHQNLNRFFRALHPKSALGDEQKQVILEALKKDPAVQEIFEQQIANNNLGVVRRADYLNLYKRIYGSDDDSKISNLEVGLFASLNKVFQENPDNLATQEMLAEIVWKNQLGGSIPAGDSSDPVQQLVQTFQQQEAKAGDSALTLKRQALLIQASAGRTNNANVYTNIVQQLYDTEDGYKKAHWFIEDLLRADNDFPFKEQVVSAYNAKLNESPETTAPSTPPLASPLEPVPPQPATP